MHVLSEITPSFGAIAFRLIVDGFSGVIMIRKLIFFKSFVICLIDGITNKSRDQHRYQRRAKLNKNVCGSFEKNRARSY